jgi:hypothetical protein
MSGLGVEPWTEEEWDNYEEALYVAGYGVEHCAHCDRSNRHPSCMIVAIKGMVQMPLPKLDKDRYLGAGVTPDATDPAS